MQCIAITARGARCRREAEPDSETCFNHRPKPEPARATTPTTRASLPGQEAKRLAGAPAAAGPARPIAPMPAGAARRPFYAPKFPPESRKAIAQAAHLEGIGEEIALLRTVIRDAAVAGQFAEARHGIADLSRILHRHQAAGAAADQLATWIEEALDILESNP